MFFAKQDGEVDFQKLERLYQQYAAYLFQVAKNIVGEKYLAEDALQQTFLKVIPYLHKIEENKEQETKYYLAVTCRHIAIDLLKESQKYVCMELWEKGNFAEPLEEMIEQEELEELLQLVVETKPKYHRVFVMRFLQGVEYREIGNRLGISEAAARKQIERTKKKLREMIEKKRKLQ